jgi:hypothetical protein
VKSSSHGFARILTDKALWFCFGVDPRESA